MKEKSAKSYLSTTEIAKLTGVSRIAIFKKIKSGEIRAEKVGRNYIIPWSEFEAIAGHFVSQKKKKEIEKSVARTVHEYGEALRRLGRE